jgi:hypothetical protein
VKHGFDVFAGAQLVIGEVRAGAVIGAPLERADMDAIADGDMRGGDEGACTPGTVGQITGEVLDADLGPAPLHPLVDRAFNRSEQLALGRGPRRAREKRGQGMDAGCLGRDAAVAECDQMAFAIKGQLQGYDIPGLLVLDIGAKTVTVQRQLGHSIVPGVAQSRADQIGRRKGMELVVVEREGVVLGRLVSFAVHVSPDAA